MKLRVDAVTRDARDAVSFQLRSDFAPKPGRRERNFWMQRQDAKNRH